jgi:hypothetical protein
MKILKFNPAVWLMLIALSVSRYAASLSPFLTEPFKLGYNIAVFALMYAVVAFENWRLENTGIDWKALCEEIGAAKK